MLSERTPWPNTDADPKTVRKMRTAWAVLLFLGIVLIWTGMSDHYTAHVVAGTAMVAGFSVPLPAVLADLHRRFPARRRLRFRHPVRVIRVYPMYRFARLLTAPFGFGSGIALFAAAYSVAHPAPGDVGYTRPAAYYYLLACLGIGMGVYLLVRPGRDIEWNRIEFDDEGFAITRDLRRRQIVRWDQVRRIVPRTDAMYERPRQQARIEIRLIAPAKSFQLALVRAEYDPNDVYDYLQGALAAARAMVR
ncbi:hypothetical protein [Tsukamurella soli]|uniref:PH domain-containing protein n=1 Tax=Tsukamurella soli TaxID=644556 RepID=A0ABP8JAN5_9ACTN